MNVVKIAPETALRLTLNDRIKAVVAKNHLERITPWERMACGGLAGASAQVPSLFVLPNALDLTTYIEFLQPLFYIDFGMCCPLSRSLLFFVHTSDPLYVFCRVKDCICRHANC